MSAHLPSGLLVSALLRRVNDAGGIGVVRARGDEQAGAILILASEPGAPTIGLERGIGPQGAVVLVRSGPVDESNPSAIEEYWRKRRMRDPDLWVVALDIAAAERFAAETILPD